MKGLCCRYGQLGVFIVCLFFTACIPEDIELPYRIMSVATGSSKNVTELSVTLSGNVTLIDSENITCGVIYGTSSNLSSSNGAKTLTNANGEFEVKISGLKANTTYYYRAYAVDAGRYKYGEVLSFTTKKNVAVTTGEAVGITTNSVNIKGTVNHAEKSLVCGIVYGTSSELSYKNGTIKSTTSSGTFSVPLTGLSSNTTYYYRAYVVVDGEYFYGDTKSFKTKGTDLCPDANHVHAVDLGLSVKWACCNVGSSVPDGYGGYYAWGETEGKSDYDWDTYRYYNSSTGDYDYIGSNISGTSYDVAHVKWGGGWRMPTRDEIKELWEKCSWEWTSVNGVNGQKVTGPNGNSIFLPAAGYRYGTEVYRRGSLGHYWSGTLVEDGSYNAYYLHFFSGCGDWYYWNYRDYGRTVRPVTDK